MARPEPVPYRVKNLKKYKGDATKVIARSSWEKAFFKWCDHHPWIVEWSSEETIIPYMMEHVNESTGEIFVKPHRYFIDCKVTFQTPEGKRKTYLVEIKPFAQTQPPEPTQGKSRKTLLEQIATWKQNEAKWEAARAYCKEYGYEFIILTEYELGLKKA
jgi:hypothetical protein